MKKGRENETSFLAGASEGDDEMADATFKKKKNWQKFWKTSKKELSGGRRNKKKTNR